MADWYYESDGNQAGPVSEERIMELIAGDALNMRSLIWSKTFGNSWKPLGETAFASLILKESANEPPPLPAPAVPTPEAVQSGGEALDEPTEPAGAKEFLGSDLARQLIGKNAEHYLRKWEAFLETNAFGPRAVAKQKSWNWSAFFMPYGWLIYRKMYGLSALVIGGVLLSQFFGPLAIAVGFGASIIVALYANAWYFDTLYKKWLRLRTIGNADVARRAAANEGETNLPMALGVGTALLVVGALISSGSDLFSSGLSCSSRNTQELVAKIAREQIPKDNYMRFVVDDQATKISFDAIRTQATGNASVNCAASIVYSLAFKAQGGDDVKAALEQVLNRQITYKVERTDRGDEIYATVFGLNN
jgi:hypothetical protein